MKRGVPRMTSAQTGKSLSRYKDSMVLGNQNHLQIYRSIATTRNNWYTLCLNIWHQWQHHMGPKKFKRTHDSKQWLSSGSNTKQSEFFCYSVHQFSNTCPMIFYPSSHFAHIMHCDLHTPPFNGSFVLGFPLCRSKLGELPCSLHSRGCTCCNSLMRFWIYACTTWAPPDYLIFFTVIPHVTPLFYAQCTCTFIMPGNDAGILHSGLTNTHHANH